MKAFKAYDIRGIYGKDFSARDVYKIGFFLPRLLNSKKVLVGRDARRSSPEIFETLTKGICDSGADVCDAGLATTPMIYWGTSSFDFDASVMITASHNPREYNGLKISRKKALPVGYDSGLKELEQLVMTKEAVPVQKRGSVQPFPFREKYLNFLKPYCRDISNLKIGIDCSNGMAGLLIHEIFGSKPNYIYDQLDGNFPNHSPNPLDPKNIRDLQKLVTDSGRDIGVIFDGDADRVMFLDETGSFISPDLMIAVLANQFLLEEKGKVLIDIRTSKSVEEYITGFGCKIEMWRVGRAYASLKLREIDGIYGGELAGHYYFRDFFYSDSGILASILILNIFSDFKRRGIKVSAVIDIIKAYANSGEINYRIEQKEEAMEQVREHFCRLEKPEKFYDFDGYRIEFKDWWFNIRPSNTEPYLRFIAEAKTKELLNNKIRELNSLLEQYT